MTSAVLLFAALLLAGIAYYKGLSGDYLFDDVTNLLLNKQIQISQLNAETLTAAAFSYGSGIETRALTMLSFALNYYFFGIHPFSFKLINLLIHLLNGVGLFLLANQLLTAYRRIYRPEITEETTLLISLAVAAAWLLHPLNLTAVLYVVQRMTSLATLFMIAGLNLYVWGRLRLWEHKSGLHLILIGLLVFGPLAFLCKQIGALLPLYMLVIEITLFRFRNQAGQLDHRISGFFIAALLLPAIGCLIWLVTDPQRFLGNYAVRPFTLDERLLTEARVVLFYLRLIIAPSLAALGFYHDDIPLSHGWLDPLSTLPSVIAVIGLPVGALLLRRKAPLVSLGILWFFAGHMLESTILPLEITFEHRNYLADFGILFALFFLLLDSGLSAKTLQIRRASAAIFIAIFFGLTLTRATHWDNSVDQAIYSAAHHPRSARATYSAGRVYANLALTGHPQFTSEAFQLLRLSQKLDKYGIMADVSIIELSEKLKIPFSPSVVADIKHKLSEYPISPGTVLSLKELARCQESACKIDNQQMGSILRLAMQNRWIPHAKREYGDVMTIDGTFLVNRLNDLKGAQHLFEMAVQTLPNSVTYRINLVGLLLAEKQYDEARKQLRIVRAINRSDQFFATIEGMEAALNRAQGHPETSG